jgi:hypothetical protein
MRRVAAAGTIIVATVVASGCGSGSRGGDSAAASAPADTAGASVDARGDTSNTDRTTPPTAGQGTSAGASRPGSTPAGGRPGGPSNATSVRPAAGADTLRGIIRVVGSSADEQVVVRPNAGGVAVTLLGSQSPVLGRLSGVDVWLSGRREGERRMTVDHFLVRSVSGVPAIDGTLIARDGGFAIVTTADHAEHPIVNPPAALRSHVGGRVWITGPLETGAVTFGVISDR